MRGKQETIKAHYVSLLPLDSAQRTKTRAAADAPDSASGFIVRPADFGYLLQTRKRAIPHARKQFD